MGIGVLLQLSVHLLTIICTGDREKEREREGSATRIAFLWSA